MVSRSLVLGFHGCDQAVAQRVISNREELLLHCAVMQTLHKLREDRKLQAFETVRGFFVEGRALYPDSGFRELDHVQVCVRSPEQVLGYFWPREA